MPAPPKQLTKYRRSLKDKLTALCKRWARGGTPWSDLDDEAQDLLTDGHAEAARLGRLLGGDTSDDPDGDEAIAEDVWDGEVRHWRKVVKDIERGRYGVPGDDGNPADAEKLGRRVGLYSRKLVATANDAWVDAEPDETLYEWIATAKESCSDCARWEAGSPYRAEDLPAVPGDSASICRTGCACFLKSDDGTTGFQMDDDD